MQSTINRASPTLGMALAYFIIVAWAQPQGYIPEGNGEEAVAMAGVIVTNLIMETKAFLGWVGAFFVRDRK